MNLHYKRTQKLDKSIWFHLQIQGFLQEVLRIITLLGLENKKFANTSL